MTNEATNEIERAAKALNELRQIQLREMARAIVKTGCVVVASDHTKDDLVFLVSNELAEEIGKARAETN